MEIKTRFLNLFVSRFKGNDTTVASEVIRAFYVLFSELGDEIELSEDTDKLRSSMINVLSRNKFPTDFSMKIVDFVLENRALIQT